MAMKTCSRCRQPMDREGQRYCRRCHAAYQRAWRRRGPRRRVVYVLRVVYVDRRVA